MRDLLVEDDVDLNRSIVSDLRAEGSAREGARRTANEWALLAQRTVDAAVRIGP